MEENEWLRDIVVAIRAVARWPPCGGNNLPLATCVHISLLHVYSNVCIFVCMCVYVYVCVCVHVYVYVFARSHVGSTGTHPDTCLTLGNGWMDGWMNIVWDSPGLPPPSHGRLACLGGNNYDCPTNWLTHCSPEFELPRPWFGIPRSYLYIRTSKFRTTYMTYIHSACIPI